MSSSAITAASNNAKGNVSRYLRYYKNLEKRPQQRAIRRLEMTKQVPEFYKNMIEHNVDKTEMLKPNEWLFKTGDRVQIQTGADKGRVGKISQIFEESNRVVVEGLGGSTRVLLPTQAFQPGQTHPIVNMPNSIPVNDLRLVVSDVNEEGKEKDYVVHSLTLEGEKYDPDYNDFLPIRRLANDPDTIIPWPRPEEPLKPSVFATSADVVGQRTFFPNSLLEPPIPTAALSQIRNVHSKFKRRPVVTAEDLKRMTPPVMPTPLGKKEYKAKLAAVKRTVKKAEGKEWKDIQDFVGSEIEKGLQDRLVQEEAALHQYQ